MLRDTTLRIITNSRNKSSGRDNLGIRRPKKAKKTSQGKGSKFVCHTLNTLAGGFTGGEETSFARKRYTRQILNIKNLLNVEVKEKLLEATNTFSEKEAVDIHSHNDNPMVISVKCD